MNEYSLEYRFKGKLKIKERFIDRLKFKVTISDKVYPKEIKGFIVGKRKTYQDLEEFLKVEKGDISIEGITEYNDLVTSQKCYMKRAYITVKPQKKFEIEKEIAELELLDLHIEKKKKFPCSCLPLSIAFDLDNRGILNNVFHRLEMPNKNGSIEITKYKEPKVIETEIGELLFSRNYIYLPISVNEKKGKYRYKQNVATFDIEEVNEINYLEKIHEAIVILEDYLFLISFISRTGILWNRYVAEVVNNTRIISSIEHFKKGFYPREEKQQRDDFIIDLTDFDDFLKISYLNYVKNKDYLKNILSYYLSSQEERLMSSSFLLLCVCLESLVYGYGPNRLSMNHKQYKNLKKLIRPIISDFCIKNRVDYELVDKKILELQSSPIKERLESLIQSYNIYIKDLYPGSERKYQFFSLRNKLIHQGKVTDYRELFYEKLRLQFLVERIILSILGWGREKYSSSFFTQIISG